MSENLVTFKTLIRPFTSIGNNSKASHGKSKATKSKLAPKSKPLKKVHQKSVDEVHPKKDRKRERYRPEMDLVNPKKVRKKEGTFFNGFDFGASFDFVALLFVLEEIDFLPLIFIFLTDDLVLFAVLRLCFVRKKEGHQPVIDMKKENEKRLIIANRSKGSYQCFECDEIFRHLPDLCRILEQVLILLPYFFHDWLLSLKKLIFYL
jgi:hypothetical protein